jgi:putative transposase
VNVLCQMTGLSRAGFYRWRAPRLAAPVEMEIRDQMQKVALESPAYGYRRITSELQQRGFAINHKRVLRMMREDNLLCVRRRAFVVTTDSRHNLPVYPNLARDIRPRRSTSSGSPTSHIFACAPSSYIWLWCWTHSRGV